MPAVLRTVTATRYVTPAARGRLAAGHRRGRRRRPLRAQVPRRGPGPEGARGRDRGRRAGPRPRAAGARAGAGRARPGARQRRARPGDPGADRAPARGSTSASTSCPARCRTTPTQPPDAELAADVVWLDALVTNVDRTPRNPNLLRWHAQPVADRPRRGAVRVPRRRPARPRARRPFPAIRDHVLLPRGGLDRRRRRAAGAARADPRAAAALVPAEWADGAPYAEFLARAARGAAGVGARRPSVPAA